MHGISLRAGVARRQAGCGMFCGEPGPVRVDPGKIVGEDFPIFAQAAPRPSNENPENLLHEKTLILPVCGCRGLCGRYGSALAAAELQDS